MKKKLFIALLPFLLFGCKAKTAITTDNSESAEIIEEVDSIEEAPVADSTGEEEPAPLVAEEPEAEAEETIAVEDLPLSALKFGPFVSDAAEAEAFAPPESPYEEAEFLRDLLTEDGGSVLLVKKGKSFEILPAVYDEVKDPYDGESPFKISEDWSGRGRAVLSYPEHRYDRRYIPVRMGERWGFADVCHNGELTVPAVFEAVHPFKEGLGAVKYEGLWGFVDGGHMVVASIFAKVHDFFNGLCIVEYTSDDGGYYWGCLNKGNTLIFAYPDKQTHKNGVESIGDFYEPTITKVKTNNGQCALAPDGTILLEGFDESEHLGSSAYFHFDWGCRTLCICSIFDEERFLQAGGKHESDGTTFGAFDRHGHWIFEPVYSSQKELEKLIAEKGGTISSNANRLFRRKIEESGLVGFENNKGEWVVPPQFLSSSYSSYDKYAVVEKERRKFGVIDKAGNFVIEPIYRDINTEYFAGKTCFVVEQNDKRGLADERGTLILPIEYDQLYITTHGYTPSSDDFPLVVRKDGTDSFINADGSEFLPLGKDDKVRVADGIALVFSPAPERPAKRAYAQSYRVRCYLPDGTELFPDTSYYEEFYMDMP